MPIGDGGHHSLHRRCCFGCHIGCHSNWTLLCSDASPWEHRKAYWSQNEGAFSECRTSDSSVKGQEARDAGLRKKARALRTWDETKLRNYDGDVNENLAEKKTPHPFKPFRDYLKSPSYLKEGNSSWSWREGTALARVQTEMVEFITLPFLFSRKLQILLFHVVVEQGRQRKEEKGWCIYRAVVLLTKPIVILTLPLLLPS